MRALNALLLVCFSTLLFGQSVSAAEFATARPDRLDLSGERLANLDTVMKAYVERGEVAGQVILVLRDGRIAFSAANGYRDLEAGLPMTEDTIFRIASQTKAIVSTGIMILHERGLLDIAHPISRYLPEWADAQVGVPDGQGGYTLEPLERAITVRHLLTHTSGISYGLFSAPGPARAAWQASGLQGWYLAGQNRPIREIAAQIASFPLYAQPGERWLYGYNTDLLGAIIEVASGQDLSTFLQQEIFAPLDMRDTHFYLPTEKSARLAVVYQPDADGLTAMPEGNGMYLQGNYVEDSGPNRAYSGGAGLLSTARDYARFLQMMLNEGELDDNRILSPKTVELMTTDHLNGIPYNAGQGFGLGFSVLKDLGARGSLGSEGEYGWGGAYHSTYWVDPEEDLVVVYLTQFGSNTGGIDDYVKLRSGIYAAIID